MLVSKMSAAYFRPRAIDASSRSRSRTGIPALAVTYAILPVTAEGSRLLAVVRGTTPTSRAAALRDRLLAWGDLVMMRKQLLTFAELAAQEHAERSSAQPTV